MFNVIIVLFLLLMIFFAYSVLKAKQSGNLQTYSKFKVAKNYYEENNFLACEEAIMEILEEFPNHLNALVLLMELYNLIDRKKSLPDVYLRLLDLPSLGKTGLEKNELRLSLADVCYDLGHFSEAFEHYLKLISSSKDVELLNRVALLYASQAKYLQAQKLYEKILSEEPQHIDALRGVIRSLVGLDLLIEAKQHLEKMVDSLPYDSYELYLLARVYDQSSEHEKSRQTFEKYFKESSADYNLFLQDAYDYVIQWLYDLDYIETGKFSDNWISYLRKYLETFEYNATVKIELFWLLGWLYFFSDDKRSNLAKAIDMWAIVVESDPEYHSTSALVDLAKAGGSTPMESLEEYYYNFKGSNRNIFKRPELPEIQNFYNIPAFDIDVIEARSKGSMSMLQTLMAGYTKLTIEDLLKLPLREFEMKIQGAFKAMKLKVQKSLGRDESGVLRYVLAGASGKASIYCQVYKNSSQIGDMEVKTYVSEMKSQKIKNGILITFGSLTVSAGALAKEKKIKVITGDTFESLYLK
ncbi:MAG: restriction endonuclease [Candidatus Cloacimonetes bacterium]|nr:restriction endonuclease [Candidatus Cloacimonadota bacterium]